MFRHIAVALFASLALGALPAQAEPATAWTKTGFSAPVFAPELVPERKIALAGMLMPPRPDQPADASSYDLDQGVAVYDLETGERLNVIIPLITSQPGSTGIIGLAADKNTIAILTEDGEAGARRSYHIFGYDAETFAPLYETVLPHEAYPDHGAFGAKPKIAGDKLLIDTSLREAYEDHDPIMQVFDLRTGAFIRGIDLMAIDSEAEEGWFGRRPKAPDYFFLNAVTHGSTLFVTDRKSGDVLTYDVAADKIGPRIAMPEQEGKEVSLMARSDDKMYYGLYTPLVSDGGSIIKQAEIWGIPLDGTGTKAVFADPFPVEQPDLTVADIVMTEIESGQQPYTGSAFPDHTLVSGRYLVAGVPAALLPPVQGTALAVFDAATGKQLDLLAPQNPAQQDFNTGSFALKDDLLLVAGREWSQDETEVEYQLRLYRLGDR